MKKSLARTTKFLAMVVIAFCLTACDPITKTEQVGEPAWQVQMSFTGSKSGFCYGCGLGFDGKYDCSIKFRTNCDCSYKADGLVLTEKHTHESGAVSYSTTVLERKNATECN